MLSTIKDFWDKNRFSLCIFFSLSFLAYIYLFYNKEGTYTKDFKGINIERKKRKICKKKHETRCREILEQLYYPHKFPSVRPDFLKNPETKKNLEIDCYNHDLRLGLEYNGVQHRTFTPYFHKTVEDFNKQVKRDKYKMMTLSKLGIKMIYVPDTVKFIDLREFIVKQLNN